MSDNVFSIEETSDAFRFASHWWRSIVGAVDDDGWDRPGLGEWTVRELVAHTDRAYRTVIDYLTGDTVDPTAIATAAGYFRLVLAEETPHVHIAARAKREAVEHDDWVATTDELALHCEKLIVDTPGDAICHLMVGEMALAQYLATRVVELVVHGLDLADAIGLEVNPPPVSAEVVVRVLLDLAGDAGLGTAIRGLTGRPVSPSAHVLR
jgi:uncharacterized protein (TIGR03083 family)